MYKYALQRLFLFVVKEKGPRFGPFRSPVTPASSMVSLAAAASRVSSTSQPPCRWCFGVVEFPEGKRSKRHDEERELEKRWDPSTPKALHASAYLWKHQEVTALARDHEYLDVLPPVPLHVSNGDAPSDQAVPRLVLLQVPPLPRLERNAVLARRRAHPSPFRVLPALLPIPIQIPNNCKSNC
mmetsp:Transcript_7012/g.20488  ORF Transcript_7012/g.20488 Transcript_7012/m.20488 type:complete len:183 (+) Transcript_7012:813-1361(+)